MRLSHSQASTINGCGVQWVLGRHLKLPEQPRMATLAGSAVHKITEALDLARVGIVTFDPTTPDEWSSPSGATVAAARTLDRLMKDALDRTEGAYRYEDIRISGKPSKAWPNKHDRQFMVHHIPGWVQNWTDWLDNSPWDIWISEDGQPGIELDLSFKVGDQNITGSIDRVLVHQGTGEIAIVDLKAGSWVPNDLSQPELYKYGLKQKFDVDATVGGFFMNRTNKMEKWGWLRPDEKLLEHKYNSTAAKAEQGLLAYDTEKCAFMCSVRDHCPIYGGKSAISVDELLEGIRGAAKAVREGVDMKSSAFDSTVDTRRFVPATGGIPEDAPF